MSSVLQVQYFRKSSAHDVVFPMKNSVMMKDKEVQFKWVMDSKDEIKFHEETLRRINKSKFGVSLVLESVLQCA